MGNDAARHPDRDTVRETLAVIFIRMDTRPFYTTRAFYLSMTTSFIIVLAVVFVFATRTLLTQVDATLATETASQQELSLDTGHYALLKQKLGLPDVAPSVSSETSVSSPSTSTAATTTAAAATSTPAEAPLDINLSTLTVAVRNGTGISGLAGKLRDDLVAAGFPKATTGNSDKQSRTEIYIRADIRDAVVAILKEKLPTLLDGADIMDKEPTSANIVIILGVE